jgi:hypothetical protein
LIIDNCFIQGFRRERQWSVSLSNCRTVSNLPFQVKKAENLAFLILGFSGTGNCPLLKNLNQHNSN